MRPAGLRGLAGGHGISTAVTPAGGGLAGLKNWSSVQETWYASGTQACQPTSEATATCSPGRTPLALTGTFAACAAAVAARETWLVIWVTASRLTAATQAPKSGTAARQRRAARAKPIHAASRPSVTAVASSTLAWVQFWVSTAGSAKLNADPNPAVGSDDPA